MRDTLAHAWLVLRKDLVLEWRARTAFLSTLVFTVLVLLVFNFGRDPTAIGPLDLAPSVLWVTFTFAAMLALNRAFQLELENQALDGLLLAPVSRHSIYLGKLGANLAFLTALVALGVPKIPAQALAIALVTPWNFVANKLWSFRRQASG